LRRNKLICTLLLSVALLVPIQIQAIPSRNYEEPGLEIEQIRKELTEFWEKWYEKQDWGKEHVLKNIPEMAGHAAEAIYKFQHEPVPYNWRDDLTVLPKGKDVHFVLGSMAITETSLDPTKIGKKGEAGLLQCHPKWCMRDDKRLAKMSYKKRIEIVKQNPKLGIELGIRFFSKNVGWCGREIRQFDDWAYPVSSYTAGSHAFRNGRCIKMKVVRKRINRAKWYRSVIRSEKPLLSKIIFGFKGFSV
jgi:hypothetical protein